MSATKSKRGARTPAREWTPLVRAVPTPQTPEAVAAFVAEMVGQGYGEAEAEAAVTQLLAEPDEVWINDQVQVHVDRHPERGYPVRLSIRRQDRKALRDWRVFQQIKNELCGYEAEAVELFPADARLVDTANHYWLWCIAAGERFPFGFQERAVFDRNHSPAVKSVQRPITGVGHRVHGRADKMDTEAAATVTDHHFLPATAEDAALMAAVGAYPHECRRCGLTADEHVYASRAAWEAAGMHNAPDADERSWS